MDRKRITGPEFSVRPLPSPENMDTSPTQTKDPQMLTPFILKYSVVPDATSSAYFESGHTKIICSVFGPRQITKGKEDDEKAILNVEFKYLPFSCTEHQGYAPSVKEKELSKFIREALVPAIRLELYPRTVVDVYVNVLEEGSDVVSGSVNCASAALLDSGIEMLDSVVCCSASINDKQIYLEGNDVVVAYMPNLEIVTQISLGSIADLVTSQQAIRWCIEGCNQIVQSVHKTIK